MKYRYKHSNIKRARKLRKHMTEQECTLWFKLLRDFKPRFRRQKTIGKYIVDFCCSDLKLILEVDGSQHYTDKGLAYDKKRDNYLRSQGYEVIRVPNDYLTSDYRLALFAGKLTAWADEQNKK